VRFSHACFGALLGAALVVPQMVWLSPAAAAVYSPKQALSAPVIQEFLANPSALLTQYPIGGAQMIARVRDLAASDPSTLNPIVGLLATANANQSTAIGTGLGQVALMAVKTDQAYANQIQEAIAGAIKGHDVGPVGGAAGVGSQLKIGNAVKAINKVDGVTEKGEQPVVAGSEIFVQEVVRTGPSGKAEFLFTDRTNLAVGPVTTIRLDKYVYDPNGSGDVVLEAVTGTFRFITGVQDSQHYEIKTPFGSIGVRGTEFIVTEKICAPLDANCKSDMQIQVVSGEVTLTLANGQQVTVTAGNTLSVSSSGDVTVNPTTASQQSTFADLGTPTTNVTLADALSAFSAVTGTGAAAGGVGGGGGAGGGGGGTGGGGGSITGYGATGGFGGGGGGFTPNFSTFVVNTPGSNFNLSFTGSTPSTTTTTTSASPH